MQRCLDLAQLAKGHTSPNPMVGAVLVCNERVIGEGYHHFYGAAHAEVTPGAAPVPMVGLAPASLQKLELHAASHAICTSLPRRLFKVVVITGHKSQASQTRARRQALHIFAEYAGGGR